MLCMEICFLENKDDFGNFFTKRIKMPPAKYATDTDVNQDGTEEANKKKKKSKNDKKIIADEINNGHLMKTVSIIIIEHLLNC